jgi:hypothetical protein
VTKMIRRIFTLLCALSLVACLATAALWARSNNWRYDDAELQLALPARWPARVYSITVESARGRLRLTAMVYQDDPNDPDPGSRLDKPRWRWFRSSDAPDSPGVLEVDYDSSSELGTPWARILSAGYERAGMQYTYGGFKWRKAILPHKFVVAATAMPGAWAAVWGAIGIAKCRTRRSRKREQLCEACGYDLRATPSRCPECGYGTP